MKSRIAFLALFLMGVFAMAPAKAATVDFPGLFNNFGLVSYGQTGDVNNVGGTGTTGLGVSSVGLLPANATISFIYSLSSPTPAFSIYSQGTYFVTAGGKDYAGLSNMFASQFASFGTSFGTTYNPAGSSVGTPSASLVFATAGLLDATHGYATISNLSSFVVAFANTVTLSAGSLIHYQVSAVPVPASILLFGSSLVGMAGVAWRRRSARRAAVA